MNVRYAHCPATTQDRHFDSTSSRSTPRVFGPYCSTLPRVLKYIKRRPVEYPLEHPTYLCTSDRRLEGIYISFYRITVRNPSLSRLLVPPTAGTQVPTRLFLLQPPRPRPPLRRRRPRRLPVFPRLSSGTPSWPPSSTPPGSCSWRTPSPTRGVLPSPTCCVHTWPPSLPSSQTGYAVP